MPHNFTFKHCGNNSSLKTYQHQVYAVVYSVILAPGLLGNVLVLWVFRIYIKKKNQSMVFMMNLTVADLLQVLSLPLMIYYYLNKVWPFGHVLCMVCIYVRYVNMYASIYFLVCISVRRCQLIVCPLSYNSSKQKGDFFICVFGWLLVCCCCLLFPFLRNPSSNSASDYYQKCFLELPLKSISPPAVWALLVGAELLGFIIPLILVLTCTFMIARSLRKVTARAVTDKGKKKRALKMVLSCTAVFLLCFAPYHITLPLDFLAKSNKLSDCSVRDLIQRCHTVNLCLASLNCSLDPLMYCFTSKEFWKHVSFNRSMSGDEDD
uniref:G protein-coupled receptor 174 n=2 Tax=Kryptolebias marmoratus TaxID=37003 RepID=A0A3Q3B888_KRYMA